jgi:hypothetical protein
MADQRKIIRAQAKLRTAATKRIAEEQATVRYARIAAMLGAIRYILNDNVFVELVRAQGVQSLPRPLLANDAPAGADTAASSKRHLDHPALNFAVAWRFFAPLLGNPALVSHLDTNWPGFTLELRDVFISIVADGPFPHQPHGRRRRTI